MHTITRVHSSVRVDSNRLFPKPLGLVILLIQFAIHTDAANKYWVGSGVNTNAPGGGTWQTTAPVVWSDGTAAMANSGWADGDSAFFGGTSGTYGIKVAGAINTTGLHFSASGYTLTNDTPSVITPGTSPFLTLPVGTTNTIGTNVTVSVGFPATASLGNVGGTPGGTLIIGSGGIVQETSTRPLNINGSGTVVSVRSGGVFKNASAAAGTPVITIGGAVGDDAVLSVDGGIVSIARTTASIWVPTGPTAITGNIRGTLTLNAGSVSTTGGFIELGNATGNVGTLNLNGGTLSTSQVIGGAGTSVVNFNGGVLQAIAGQSAFMTSLTTINVRSGGAVIDCGGNDVTIGQPLVHSTIIGDGLTDGGLTVIGTGTLALNGTNTYSGITSISSGTLALGGSLRGPVTISSGGVLSGGNSEGPISISNNLTLGGMIVLRVDKAAATNDFVQGVTNLSYGGTLALNLTSGTWNAGDVFTLFKAKNFAGTFSQITATPALPGNLTWDTSSLLLNGSIRIVPLALNYATVSNALSVSWNTMPWYQYQLITTTNVARALPLWDVFGAPLLGNGGIISQTIPILDLPQQFFSLMVIPMAIDSSRLPPQPWQDTQWNDPGGWTTIDVTTQGLPADNTNVDAAVQIASIINSTSGRRRLYFPTGTYSFKSSLAVNNKSDLWFDGDGRGNTVFRIDAPGSANAEIGFYGGTSGSPLAVTGSLVAGNTSVNVADASTLNVGDLIQLYADNAPLAQGGLAFVTHIYGQMCTITAKNGNTLTLDMKVLLNYPASITPLVQKYNQIKNIKVSNLLISRVNEPTNEDVSNLEFFDAINCYVVHLESNFSQRHHIYFQNSKNCVIESNYIHDCFVHMTGGYGYGYGLVGSTGCRVSNNKSTRLRHQIIFQIGANYNVASYNSIEVCYDYNDMALHAAYAYMNLFEGNMVTESYADTSKDGSTTVEPSTGPENTWFRNFATGMVGSIQSATSRQNVIGNDVGTIVSTGSDHYIGANNVSGVNQTFGVIRPAGTVNWGVFPTNAVFPASLYLTNRPIFFAAGVPWPAFGPGVPNWGVTNLIPARIRIPTDP